MSFNLTEWLFREPVEESTVADENDTADAPQKMAAPPADVQKWIDIIDEFLKQAAATLPIGRGYFAAIMMQGLLAIIVPRVWPDVQKNLAAKGIKV